MQQRAGHLQTHFAVQKSEFEEIATKLTSVSPKTLESVANHLKCEGKIENLNENEKSAMLLLNKVTAISAHIPGSQASKIYVHNEIRSYFSKFGLPHLYFTFNPSAIHSPLFQLMYGDNSIDLSSHYPILKS